MPEEFAFQGTSNWLYVNGIDCKLWKMSAKCFFVVCKICIMMSRKYWIIS